MGAMRSMGSMGSMRSMGSIGIQHFNFNFYHYFH